MIIIGKENPNRFQKAVGKCPICNKYPFWFNDVPLKAYCSGSEKKPHKEWTKVVPTPHNPYLKPFNKGD